MNMTPHRAPDGAFHTSRSVLIAGGLLALLLLALAVVYYLFFIKAPADLARNLASGVREVFQITPRVTVNQTVVVEENMPIAELATTARDVYVDYTWSHTWLGSTKTIQLQGIFTAKAGFDFREPFTLSISGQPPRVSASLPPPKLLSLEMKSYRVIRDDSGWWNRLTETDRESAVHELQALARTQAEQSSLLAEARRTAEHRLQQIVEQNGATVTFESIEGSPMHRVVP